MFWKPILAQCAGLDLWMRCPQKPAVVWSRLVLVGLSPRGRVREGRAKLLFVPAGTVGHSAGVSPMGRGGDFVRSCARKSQLLQFLSSLLQLFSFLF